MKAFLTAIGIGIIIKQLADWCRTISAGAIILGVLNPAILGDPELARKAIYVVGAPALALCLAFSVVGVKIDSWKKGA